MDRCSDDCKTGSQGGGGGGQKGLVVAMLHTLMGEGGKVPLNFEASHMHSMLHSAAVGLCSIDLPSQSRRGHPRQRCQTPLRAVPRAPLVPTG